MAQTHTLVNRINAEVPCPDLAEFAGHPGIRGEEFFQAFAVVPEAATNENAFRLCVVEAMGGAKAHAASLLSLSSLMPISITLPTWARRPGLGPISPLSGTTDTSPGGLSRAEIS